MLKKRKLTNGKVRVTFSMPPLEKVTTLHLVGDFNNWDKQATPMLRQPDGSWLVKLDLEPGRAYFYRYLADGEIWHNDWAADAYVRNLYGSDDSAVVL